ncbi:glycine betaine ABC transporter substrate-binding protein [Paenibacillus beijingensis]|uniref:glycine betaine ABC transporter substrate-binding protein n=1 Tax=Paenibacillus beijingensis TaxID=1126833 RepID=UPI000A5C1843|nr:glycine betaine ABC transporter substrate-binding protein [Paenibacillus beijingensis]
MRLNKKTASKLGLLLTAVAMVAFILSGCGGKNDAATASGNAPSSGKKELRIGHQKYGTLSFLRAQGTLDKVLKEQGYTVTWTEFPGGPQLLEALNVGSIDFGSTGEAPPIFAQAASTELVYLGYEPPSPQSEAILVQEDSPIKSVAELKGKKVALNKGSNVHYLLVKHLEKAGLKENLLWGSEDATADEIVEATGNAQIHDTIMKLPMQYDGE